MREVVYEIVSTEGSSKHGDVIKTKQGFYSTVDTEDIIYTKIEDLIEKLPENMKLIDDEGNVVNNLMVSYRAWRKVSEEMLEDGMNGSVDCGEQSVREDFSNYADLDEEISFEKMLELEEGYEA